MAAPACGRITAPTTTRRSCSTPTGTISRRSATCRRDAKEHGRRLRCYCGMADQDKCDRVWDVVETVGVCMLTTHFAGGVRARPLEARPDRDAGLIWFVTDVRSGKEHEIEADQDIGLVFIDQKQKA